jgi:hypothetical protein
VSTVTCPSIAVMGVTDGSRRVASCPEHLFVLTDSFRGNVLVYPLTVPVTCSCKFS